MQYGLTIVLSVIRGSTNSVRSSVYDFVEENGRTFHRYKEGSKSEFSILFSLMCESRGADERGKEYVLPNDAVRITFLSLKRRAKERMVDRLNKIDWICNTTCS